MPLLENMGRARDTLQNSNFYPTEYITHFIPTLHNAQRPHVDPTGNIVQNSPFYRTGNLAVYQHSLSDLFWFHRNDSPPPSMMPWVLSKLLIPLGIDMQRWPVWPAEPAMLFAVSTDDMRLVRTLLYYNYDFSQDQPAAMAYRSGRFEILKVLFLCGDKLTEDEGEFTNEISPWIKTTEEDIKAGLWLKEWLEKPPSLTLLCRMRIRNIYKTDLPGILRSIAYPRKLKRFLRTEILL